MRDVGSSSGARGDSSGAPGDGPAEHAAGLSEPRLFIWSAPDEHGEAVLRQELATRLETSDPETFGDTAEATVRRFGGARTTHHRVRGAVVAADKEQAVGRLRSEQPLARSLDGRPPRPVGLLFPGHGSQHPRMGAGLYRRDPVFTAAMDDFFTAYEAAGGEPLLDEWLAATPSVSIDEGDLGQPLLYAVGHALARMVASWGARPTVLLGHSVGELAAATVADVISAEDGARLMAARSGTYAPVVAGGLLAVAASPDQLAPYAVGPIGVAVVNGPRQTVLGGPEAELAALHRTLRADGYTARRTRIRQPFHTPHAIVSADLFEPAFADVRLAPPALPLYSSSNAARVGAKDATRPRFWARQMSDPVLFGPALDLLLDEHEVLLVEAGPSQALTTLALRHPAVADGRSAAVALLPAKPGPAAADREAALTAAARMWLEGHRLDWRAVNAMAITG
ncbi:acyltransferase domain-containing protein [Streptomyces sp. NPDC059063]|uniref:acyltransferase domain-containing protein n=1 Tax=unclassified Streptomyces TaxID=2593676 RepID=UPI0036B82547